MAPELPTGSQGMHMMTMLTSKTFHQPRGPVRYLSGCVDSDTNFSTHSTTKMSSTMDSSFLTVGSFWSEG